MIQALENLTINGTCGFDCSKIEKIEKMNKTVIEDVDTTQWDYIQIHRNYIVHKAEEALNIQKKFFSDVAKASTVWLGCDIKRD